MSQTVFTDKTIGRLEKNEEADSWQAKWQFNNDKSVTVSIDFYDEPETLPEQVSQFFAMLKDKDPKIRRDIAKQMIGSANDDWNPDEKITEQDFATRISLDGVLLYYPNDGAEVFYEDDDIFAGHAIATKIDFDGNISKPYLAG